MVQLIDQRGSPFITEMLMADTIFQQRQSADGSIHYEKTALARQLHCVFTFTANLEDEAGVSQLLGD